MQLYSGTAGGSFPLTLKHTHTLLVASGLAGVEEAKVQVWNGAGWQDYLNDSQAVVKLTTTIKNLTLLPPGDYQIVVTASAGTVRIAYYTDCR